MNSFNKIFSIVLFVATASVPVFAMQPGDENGEIASPEISEQDKKEIAKLFEWVLENPTNLDLLIDSISDAPKNQSDHDVFINEHISDMGAHTNIFEQLLPIHAAAYSGNLKSAKALMQGNFVDVNIVCNHPDYPLRGKTALHLATEAGHVEMVTLLLENGAMAVIDTPINKKEDSDFHKKNPLDVAIFMKNFANHHAPQLCAKYDQIIQILLAAGAVPSAPQPAQS